MRAILCLSAMSLMMPRLVLAQGIPEVPDASITCEEGSPHAGEQVTCDGGNCERAYCYCWENRPSHCGGGSGGGSSGGGSSAGASANQDNVGVPPIVSAMVALIFLAAAPVFTLEFKRDPAMIRAEEMRAAAAWRSHRDEVKRTEAEGKQEQERERRERAWSARFKRELAASKRKPVVSDDFKELGAANKGGNADQWGEHGYCSEVLKANAEHLARTKLAVDKEAIKSALEAAGGGAANSVAAEILLKQRDRLREQAAEGEGFLRKLQSCIRLEDLAANRCLNALIKISGPLKAELEKLLGVPDSLAKARDFAAFHSRNVTELRVQAEKAALAVPRCLQ